MLLECRSILMVLMFLVTSLAVSAQNRTITGQITGGDNEPLIGASVVVKGTTKGSVTDIDGKFSLEAPENATLVVSFVGYATQEVAAGSQSSINVVLSSSTLDEVVVTGYAIETKKSTTGAVYTIKAKDLRSIPSGNVEQQLQGRVAGVTVISNAR